MSSKIIRLVRKGRREGRRDGGRKESNLVRKVWRRSKKEGFCEVEIGGKRRVRTSGRRDEILSLLSLLIITFSKASNA